MSRLALVVLMLITRTAAGETRLPQDPLVVRVTTLDQRPVAVLDWGQGGHAQARDVAVIREEQNALTRWTESAEFQGAMLVLAEEGADYGQEQMLAAIDDWWRAYRHEARPCPFPRRTGVLVDEMELPPWARVLPATVRGGLEILFFDDADQAQRDWVELTANERLHTMALCTAWRSGELRDTYWQQRSRRFGTFAPVASDEASRHYGILYYPARITFPDGLMRLEQGIDPERLTRLRAAALAAD